MQATGFMADTLSVTLPDGSVREVAAGTTPADIAASISPGLLKASLAARVDGEQRDLGRPFEAAATDRKSAVWGKGVSVRVGHGCRRINEKQPKKTVKGLNKQ